MEVFKNSTPTKYFSGYCGVRTWCT